MNEKLNFHDLVGLLSEKAGITKKDAENFLREFFDLTTNALLEDKQVKIKNLGTFKIVDVNDRESVDVRTGERVVIPSHSKVSFVPDPALSKVVNEPFAMFEAVEVEEVAGEEVDNEPDNDSSPEEPEITPPLRKKKKKKRRKNRRGIINFVIVATTILIFAASYFILQKYDGTEDESKETAQEQSPKNFSEQINDIKLTSDSTTENIVENTEDTIINSTGADIAQKEPETPVKQINNNDNSVKQPKEIEKQPEMAVKNEPQKSVQYSVADGVKKRKIAEGERLTLIALQEYGSKDFWVYLYEENKSIIKNPGNVVIGTVITIPPASKYGIDKNNPESIKRAKELQKSMK